MTVDTSNTADTITAQDIRDRIHDIELDVEVAVMAGVAFDDIDEVLDVDPDVHTELRVLKRLYDDARQYSNGGRDFVLIRDGYFTEYTREDWEDNSGTEPRAWPYNHIDWEAAADDLRSDYTHIDYDGETYLVR